MGTKIVHLTEAAEGKGCLGKAADDEPIFILRAQDRFAAPLVRQWAKNLESVVATEVLSEGPHLSDDQRLHNIAHNSKREAQVKKIAEARALADEMDKWPKQKDPD